MRVLEERCEGGFHDCDRSISKRILCHESGKCLR